MKNETKEKYVNQAAPQLKEKFGLKNPNEIPALEKIVLNTHIGKFVNDRKVAVEDAVEAVSYTHLTLPTTPYV